MRDHRRFSAVDIQSCPVVLVEVQVVGDGLVVATAEELVAPPAGTDGACDRRLNGWCSGIRCRNRHGGLLGTRRRGARDGRRGDAAAEHEREDHRQDRTHGLAPDFFQAVFHRSSKRGVMMRASPSPFPIIQYVALHTNGYLVVNDTTRCYCRSKTTRYSMCGVRGKKL